MSTLSFIRKDARLPIKLCMAGAGSCNASWAWQSLGSLQRQMVYWELMDIHSSALWGTNCFLAENWAAVQPTSFATSELNPSRSSAVALLKAASPWIGRYSLLPFPISLSSAWIVREVLQSSMIPRFIPHIACCSSTRSHPFQACNCHWVKLLQILFFAHLLLSITSAALLYDSHELENARLHWLRSFACAHKSRMQVYHSQMLQSAEHPLWKSCAKGECLRNWWVIVNTFLTTFRT